MQNDVATVNTLPENIVNRILQGDCLDIVSLMPEECVDLVFTDPPYLVRYTSRDGRKIQNDDNDEWLYPIFAQLYRVLKSDCFAVSFYGWPHADRFLGAFRNAGFRVVGHFVFPKQYASSKRFLEYRHECAYLLAKGSPQIPENPISDVVAWNYSGNKLHPTQKPLSALLPIISSFSQIGELVLDPFAGSGSTLLAARQLQRKFLGIEIDPHYYGLAKKRLC